MKSTPRRGVRQEKQELVNEGENEKVVTILEKERLKKNRVKRKKGKEKGQKRMIKIKVKKEEWKKNY